MSLFDARAPFTSNVTDVLEPYRNGRLKAEMDGDLVVLDENLAVRHVMAREGAACPRKPNSPTWHA
jgi:beta-aspartyl-dipeptidase (metallo-type)